MLSNQMLKLIGLEFLTIKGCDNRFVTELRLPLVFPKHIFRKSFISFEHPGGGLGEGFSYMWFIRSQKLRTGMFPFSSGSG